VKVTIALAEGPIYTEASIVIAVTAKSMSSSYPKWLLPVYEGLELACFMLSACAFTVWLFDPAYPGTHLLGSAFFRRLLLGLSMGGTAVLIIHSPMGKRSGAHFNPAITLAYLRLGKIRGREAFLYIVGQFLGAIFGVGVAALLFGDTLADPSVRYAVTVPGSGGTAGAFAAELFMSSLLMAVVLWVTNRPTLATKASYFVGGLISLYVLFLAPVSGFSINPARTVGSAVFAHVWTAMWVYFTAPVIGMLGAAEAFRIVRGEDRILCAKLHPDPAYPCPFRCGYPGHVSIKPN
jgi:aquaporin Z